MRLHGSVAEACVQQWLEEINARFPQSPSAHSSSTSQSSLVAPAEDLSVVLYRPCGDGRESEGMPCVARAVEVQPMDRWADPGSELFRDQVDSLRRAIMYTQRDLVRSKHETRSRSRSRSQPSQYMRQSAESAGCNLVVEPPQQPPRLPSLSGEGQNLSGRTRVDTSDEPAPALPANASPVTSLMLTCTGPQGTSWPWPAACMSATITPPTPRHCDIAHAGHMVSE